ncbi:MAG: hypothetical protein ACPGYV_08650 [Phycisphaeraceae bacterium]
MADITPGSTVNIKIVKEPTNASARKTLVRILSKDADVVAENKRLKKVRQTNQTHSPRGGRWRVWEGRLPKQHPVSGAIGETGTVLASPDVLTDLKSVEKFVEVNAA